MTRGRAIRLSDGRTLTYDEWGSPGGRPVLECHGNPGSRILLWDERELARSGIRMITVDRPGIGGSTPWQGRSVVGFADDARELLDALGIERAAVLGYSVGGAYALGCAHRASARVESLALVASVAPLEGPRSLEELGRPAGWRLARDAPRAARVALFAQASLIRASPRLAGRLFPTTLTPEDRAVVARHPELVERGLAMGTEATRQGPAGLVEDLRTVMRPWGFRLGDVTVPTTVWHGDRDGSIPLDWARRLAREIPGARLRICPGEGHLLLGDRLADVLAALTAPAAA